VSVLLLAFAEQKVSNEMIFKLSRMASVLQGGPRVLAILLFYGILDASRSTAKSR
jgi:hypothetical protein